MGGLSPARFARIAFWRRPPSPAVRRRLPPHGRPLARAVRAARPLAVVRAPSSLAYGRRPPPHGRPFARAFRAARPFASCRLVAFG
eukprot:7889615-Lingulodinium_polyedra.AAC.1